MGSRDESGDERDGRGRGLPRPRTSFLGREREVAEAAAMLADGSETISRLLTLVGPGGIGKTRLALAVVDRLDRAATGEVAYVALAAVRDPALVLPAIAEVIRARVDERGALAGIVERIGDGRRLLLLDNMEWLVGAGEGLARLLRASPNLRMLATSRVPLGIPGECVVDVEPLSLPTASGAGDPDGIWNNAAVRLFIERARDARSDFAPTAEDAWPIAEICRRLDGIPLAIELAAARVTVLPPAALLARLERRLPLLTSRRMEQPARLRTMRDAIAWSYDLLPPGEQALFRRLSVFEGGFSLSAAERIAAGWWPADGYPFAGRQRIYGQAWEEQQGKEPPQASDGDWNPPPLLPLELEVVDALEVLAEHRLVRPVDPVEGEARFAMLETIREFGREELERTDEAFAVDHAHAALTLADAEAAGWGLWGRDRPIWLARLEADLGNIRRTFAWLATQASPANQLSLRLADAPWHFWFTCGRIAEGRGYFEATLGRPGGTAKARAAAGHTAGYLALIQGNPKRAQALLDESLELCRRSGYRIGEARCRFFLALVAWDQGNHTAMLHHAQTALALYTEADDRIGIGTSLIALAMIARGGGEIDRAKSLLTEAAASCAGIGFDWGVATCAYYDGELARSLGDDRRAALRLRDGLRLYREQGDPVGMAGCLVDLATVAVRHGDDERAARLFAAAGKLSEGSSGFLPPTDRTGYERAAEEARRRLGEERFYAASAVGYAMPIEHVLAEADLVDGRKKQVEQPTKTSPPIAKDLGLTSAQFEVLRLLGQGRNAKEIAELRCSDYVSVRQMIGRIRDRLHLNTDNELIAFAVERGIR